MTRAIDGHDLMEEEQRCEREGCTDWATHIREATETEDGAYLCLAHAWEDVGATPEQVSEIATLRERMRAGAEQMDNNALQLALRNRRDLRDRMEGMPWIIVGRQDIMVEETENEIERRAARG